MTKKLAEYTVIDLRNAESFLNYETGHGRDDRTRARARVTVGLIKYLDSVHPNWREALAADITKKLQAGELANFNPDKPFLVQDSAVDKMLGLLKIGHTDAAHIKGK